MALLSDLVNEKASLSPEMAMRVSDTWGHKRGHDPISGRLFPVARAPVPAAIGGTTPASRA